MEEVLDRFDRMKWSEGRLILLDHGKNFVEYLAEWRTKPSRG